MDKKFKTDVSWNMISFIIIGISGIILNILIGNFYGASYLGVFNLIFSVYIFLSQIAIFGIHQSTLKYIAHTHDATEISQIGYSALILTSVIALFVTLISMNLSNLLGLLFSSQEVENSWVYLSIGLFFFAMNKTLLSIINALRHMKFFAISQALRYLLALSILTIFIILDVPGEKLGYIISISEIILFLFLFIYVIKELGSIYVAKIQYWIKMHLYFGWHSLLGGIMSEINTRVDILVLGVFVSDSQVGIYTIALMFFEGFVQLTVVFRNNFNPIISKMLHENHLNDLKEMILKGKRKVYVILSPLIAVSLLLYPFSIDLFLGDAYRPSIVLYYILMLGILLSAGYLPFNMILTQAGKPLQQSLYFSSLVVGNVILNLVLIFSLGMIGAAIATASVYILNIFILKYLVKKNIGILI
ncbi:MAG TPA: hypothetical protein EYG73_00830 [Arcobacter sp.]|nr:hypothetical protein [Arcobacter sp.]